jgi:1-acyl-sn-glycerol-3-phosphate acyltransferase
MSDTIEFDARDRETFRFYETPLRKAAMRLAVPLFKPLLALEVTGLPYVPSTGPAILASNHVSNFDVFPMQLATPRPIFFMGKAELFEFAPFGAMLRDLGAFPVYRGEKDAWALRHARKVLEAGQVLGMFPEGHRSRGRGLGIARTGTARLAIEAGCEILPMAIAGSDRFLEKFPLRTYVRVAFLRRLQPKGGETPEELTERLMLAVAESLPESMRGIFAAAFRSGGAN